MKTIIMLFAVCVLLPACSVYTITNKTDRDITIKKSGGIEVTLKANQCEELSEYFLGLGGDFPVIIEGIDAEHSANNYEINTAEPAPSVATVGSFAYAVSESKKNPACGEEDGKEDDEETKGDETDAGTDTATDASQTYYTITINTGVSSSAVTVSSGGATRLLETMGSCVRVLEEQLADLEITLRVDNSVLCSNKDTDSANNCSGHYVINRRKPPGAGVAIMTFLDTAPSVNESENCSYL